MLIDVAARATHIVCYTCVSLCVGVEAALEEVFVDEAHCGGNRGSILGQETSGLLDDETCCKIALVLRYARYPLSEGVLYFQSGRVRDLLL